MQGNAARTPPQAAAAAHQSVGSARSLAAKVGRDERLLVGDAAAQRQWHVQDVERPLRVADSQELLAPRPTGAAETTTLRLRQEFFTE